MGPFMTPFHARSIHRCVSCSIKLGEKEARSPSTLHECLNLEMRKRGKESKATQDISRLDNSWVTIYGCIYTIGDSLKSTGPMRTFVHSLSSLDENHGMLKIWNWSISNR